MCTARKALTVTGVDQRFLMEGESVLAGEDLLFPCLDLRLLSGGQRGHYTLDHGVDLTHEGQS
jgi:hypothetical protein